MKTRRMKLELENRSWSRERERFINLLDDFDDEDYPLDVVVSPCVDGEAQGTSEVKPMDSVKKCPECVEESSFMPARGVDGKCLECRSEFCAAHLMIHFKHVHFMQVEMDTGDEADHLAKTGKG